MPLGDEPPSSPPDASTSLEDALRYYKTQYEQLESELADFQASSRELEAELEKDIEASEKREAQLKEKAGNLSYEVEEWKTKHRQAKAEANTVQNTLQKEITTLRDTNRTLQLRLRDIEVANDDFERQARNTTSSLEDIESKYNVAIERGVMLEEEVKTGEQEREALRIEAQRLRDELSDLKVESEIVRNKLNDLEQSTARRSRKPTPLGPGIPQSPPSERSPNTTASSPTFATPPAKSASSEASDAPTPPSPPISDSSAKDPKSLVTPSIPKTRSSATGDANTTPRPSHFSSRAPRHSRGPSIPVSTHNGRSTPSVSYRRSIPRPSDGPPGLPQSGSLYQIRGLIGKMQKLEERVHSARSRLPAPVNTPPRASPRTGSALGHHAVTTQIPSTVTVRSSRKRTGGSNVSTASSLRDGEPGGAASSGIPKNPRLSFGQPPPTPTRVEISRPSSRASITSRNSMNPHQHQTCTSQSRPGSRQSISRTPLGGGAFAPNASTDMVRPRSSLSTYGGHTRGQSMSVSEEIESPTQSTPTPRRLTFGKSEGGTGIPTPSATKKRTSNGGDPIVRRISSAAGLGREEGDMGPPERRKGLPLPKTKLTGVGETY